MDELAEVLAECGGLAGRLVELHTDDGRGRCPVCSAGGQTGRYVFPCNIRSLATRALRLQAERLAGEALRKPGPGPAF